MTQERRTLRRTFILYVVIVLVGSIFTTRLFSLQVVNSGYYKTLAQTEQLKKFEIPASRGEIYLRDGTATAPLVLNQNLQTLYADPEFIEDPTETAKQLAELFDEKSSDYIELLTVESRYVVLKKKLTPEQAEKVAALELPGIGLQDATYRVYPEGALAAQTIGFVNGEGEGQYGIEQYLDEELSGTPGLLNAVTDIRGIPLTTNDQNALVDPDNGDDVVLTLERQVQQYVEQALMDGVKRSEAISGSAIVMDPNTGRIMAMANYPTYNPANFSNVPANQAQRYLNRVVTDGYEAGSVLKSFTMAAALNEGVVTPDTTYYDAGKVQVDDREIENAGNSGGKERTMTEVIQNSVNTGVVFALEQLGGGSINREARDKLYDYFINKFGLGAPTGIAQSLEAEGLIYAPGEEQGNNVRYANMTFGQGMNVSMLQLITAFNSLVNGGTYYQPYLIDQRIDSETGDIAQAEPTVLRDGVISEQVSDQLIDMMEKVVEAGGGISAKRDGYTVGGKTGTSQVLEEDGTYSEFREIGTFIGFGASEDTVEYVIMVRVDEPKIGGYAGSVAAAPIFADISNFMIDYLQLQPKR